MICVYGCGDLITQWVAEHSLLNDTTTCDTKLESIGFSTS